jgi:hypothetical protein
MGYASWILRSAEILAFSLDDLGPELANGHAKLPRIYSAWLAKRTDLNTKIQ